ncbi:MAG: ATP-binding cassette domain-containing protein [Candidatus Margulisbacteria bacterium]|jgi:lipopolysaccharide transport system ATP-binding protein|nr:ATP-binding cassette domain-containing protein [Candidatus Margulisiibacteriota bacterium]
MSDVVLKVENLYKEYRLGVISHGTLFRDLQSWWARARGKEDPNSLVTSRQHNAQQEDDAELRQHFLALDNVSFAVKQGDILGVIGKNGAGKSTLLKVLSRITAPTAGLVKIKGRIASLLEVGTGFHPELTGRENVFMNGAILGMRRWEIAQKMDEIIAFAGLEKFIDTPVKRYSSGMYVRLAFAVAAHLDAEILLMDEVLAVGDVEFQKKALGKMGDVAKGGRTVLFVSHNMGAVKSLCNCGLLLKNGSLAFLSNTIKEIINHYENVYVSSSAIGSNWRNPGNIKNEYICPLEIDIVDASGKNITKTISNDKEFFMRFKIEILIPSSKLTIGYYLYNDNGDLIYQSHAFDGEEKFWPEQKRGINIYKTKIPARLLNEGRYKVMFISTIVKQKWLFGPDNEPIEIHFEIKGGLSDSPYWYDKREGIIAPVLEWVRE